MSFQQHVVHDLLGAYAAADLMSPDPVVVPSDLSVERLVQDHFLGMKFGGYPVVERGALVGLVTLADVKALPRDAWTRSSVADVMGRLPECAIVPPTAGVTEILEAMNRPRARGRALVVEGGRLVGIVSASDVARWVQRAQWIGGAGVRA